MNIFILTDSPYLRTGLGRICKNLIRGLSENHQLVLGCWGWDVDAYPHNDQFQWIYSDDVVKKDFIAFPIRKNPKEQIKTVYEILSRVNCDIILTVGDYWNFAGFEQLKSQLGYSFKWVSYPTIESCPIDPKYEENFKAIDEIIVPSKFGKKVIYDSFGLDSTYIPYGIDDSFFKMKQKDVKNERKSRGIDGKFRFISVCKNIFRKNIPAYLEALKLVHERDDRIIGHLHTNVDKVRDGMYDINYLIKRFELENVLTLPNKRLSNNIFISEEELNLEYNISNAFVCSSVAEGFGLPILESQRCGLIPVVPNCSAMAEIVNQGELCKALNFFAPNEQEVGVVNPSDLANSMYQVFFHKDKYRKNENISYAQSFSNKNMISSLEAIFDSDKDVKFPFDEI